MPKITTITAALVIVCLAMPATAKDKCKQAKNHKDLDAIAKFCKNAGGDDNKKHDDDENAQKSGNETQESDQASKDTKTTTTPSAANTNQNVLWGDYTSLPKQ